MNVFEYIKETVTMKDIFRKYGLSVNSAGFAVCPFHQEKTASLKIYSGDRGWYCFGCGNGGSVIDFVMCYFNVDKAEAIKIISRDFGLGIPFGKGSTYREREAIRRKVSQAIRKNEERYKILRRESVEYEKLMDEYVWADIVIMYLKPTSPEDEIYDIYKEAINKKMIIEYKLDCLGVVGK